MTSELEIIDSLIKGWYNELNFMDEKAIRDPPSKHQAQVRYLQNEIKWLILQYENLRRDRVTKE